MEKTATEDDILVSVVEHVGIEDWEKGGLYIPLHLKIEDSLRDEAISSKAIDIETAVSFLKTFIKDSDLDQHIPTETIQELKGLLQAYPAERVINGLLAYYYVFHFHSPYLEVRESIPNTDDPTLPVDTFRAWTVGLTLAIIFACLNQAYLLFCSSLLWLTCAKFFSMRFPYIEISSVCIQVLSYPLGKLCERFLPTRRIQIFCWGFTLNPGPFNQKEHMLITVMANVALAWFYATGIFEIQILPVFFNQPWARNRAYQLCIAISMQCMGYGLAGLGRSCIVFPDFCIYPHNLATFVLNRSLHEKRSGVTFKVFGRTITRYRYLLLLGTAYFIYFIIGPGYCFQALDNFNWPTWFNPKSKILAFIFGGKNGLGLNPIPTLDWNRSAQIIDPIVAPYFTVLNLAGGMAVAGFIFMVPLYLCNVWYSGYFPFNTNFMYDRMGKRINLKLLVDERGNLDLQKFRSYSPLYATAAYSAKFTFFFAAYTASVVHAGLFHYRQIWSGIKSMFNKEHRRQHQNDIHNRLMQAYDEAPHWWYAIVYVSAFVLAAIGLAKWLPEAPIWLLVFASGISVLLLVPVGIVEAVTGTSIGLNVISELVGGFVVPGKAIPMNMFKSYGCMCLMSALSFSRDLKLGHYAKVPPRSMFRAQLIATVVSAVAQVTTMNWQIDNIKGICEPDQPQKFSCLASAHTLFTSSILWGTLGPERMYGSKGIYHATLYGFAAGAFLPIPIYLLSKWRYPRLRHVYTSAYLVGGLFWAPMNLSYIIPALWIGYFFNVFIKKRYLEWWGSFNYLTSSAFTIGSAIACIFSFFALSFWGIELDWWGNSIPYTGIDSMGYAWYEVPEGGFGPRPGEFE